MRLCYPQGQVQWSWWQVSLPFWAVLGHHILYITIGFVWLYFHMTVQQKKKSRSTQGI
jgi:hypothetical protein